MDQKDMSVWDSNELDEMEFLNFNDYNNHIVKVKILDNEPVRANNKFGTPTFTFDVLDIVTNTVKQFTITSKRLMRNLKTYLPIEGKVFTIERVGSGMETDYNVIEEE